MKKALIGFTGFVGSTLMRQSNFQGLYNRKNIEEIGRTGFNLTICAAAPSQKWIANKNPKDDLENIKRLMASLKKLRTDRFILVSTIDVYPDPLLVDENTLINPYINSPYGKHRFFLESYIRKSFPKSHTIRLPALFGEGLKKNFIYDLLNNHCLEWTHPESVYQFYDMRNLWSDIKMVLKHDIPLINFSVEGTKAEDVAEISFGREFNVKPINPKATYDMRTIYGRIWGNSEFYLYTKEYALDKIRDFVNSVRNKSQ